MSRSIMKHTFWAPLLTLSHDLCSIFNLHLFRVVPGLWELTFVGLLACRFVEKDRKYIETFLKNTNNPKIEKRLKTR